jgi:4-amino-4-deoxy-L-arabinose transferase-like glycosyltransferase
MSAAVSPAVASEPSRSVAGRLPRWWPLAVLTILAAALRLSTLDLQSFWYDEAFTPIHVLHPSLWATLRSAAHTENTPPLWYLLAWADSRVLGTGELALRLPSALAGIATVPVAWAIGRELAGRRAAIACAALTAVNPLFVWYSQEARAYGLFVLTSALAMLCFLRAARAPVASGSADGAWRSPPMAAFALSGALALLTHYFAVFLLIPMVLWLLADRSRRRAALPAVGALVLVGLALLPLISAQGGHGTQWIGLWPLPERLLAIPQYYLTGNSGAPLGHGVELLLALPILAGLLLGAWRMIERPLEAVARRFGGEQAARLADERRGALIALALLAAGVLIPVVLALLGADYLAPRNLVAAMIPLTALIAVVVASPRTGLVGAALVTTIALGFLAISLDVDLSPRLQRGNWRELAHVLGAAGTGRAITTVELGGAPLQYYLPGLRNLAPGRSVLVSEIDETGYAPLRSSAGTPPAPGFGLRARLDIDGLLLYRFRSSVPRAVSGAALRRHVITLAHPEVLVAGDARLYP